MTSISATSAGTYASATSTSSIDVASIVSQLMTVANQPLTAINNQISSDNVIVSDLGSMKSKLSTFQTALTTFQSPGTYNTVSASSNNSSAISAIAQNGAAQGRYNVNVTQTAEASNLSVAGFVTATDALTLDGSFTVGTTHHTGFSITLAGKTYYSDTTYSSGSNPPTTGGTLTALPASTSLNALSSWINGLASNFNAPINSNVVQTATGAYSLVINGTSTGVSNAISFAGLHGNSATSVLGGDASTSTVSTSAANTNGLTVTSNISARDAKLSVNGLAVQRSSNSINDVINGLTFNLSTPVVPNGTAQSALITVGPGADNSSTAINGLITAYNDVINQYKSMTANSINSNSGTSGSFSNDPTMLSFISSFKQFMAQGFLTSTNRVISLANIGIDMNLDGTLAFNASNYATGQSDGSIASLANGVSIGGSVGNSNNLYLAVSNAADPGGLIDSIINSENASISNLTAKQADLKTKLAQQQTDYTTQYSNLNALLFTLNQTSTQLTSSLAGLTSK